MVLDIGAGTIVRGGDRGAGNNQRVYAHLLVVMRGTPFTSTQYSGRP